METALAATPCTPKAPYSAVEEDRIYSTLIALHYGQDRRRYLLSLDRPWRGSRNRILYALSAEDRPIVLNHLLLLGGEPTIPLTPAKPAGLLRRLHLWLYGQ